MKRWTHERKIAFFYHVAAFAIPFVISTIASVFFWTQHSGNLFAGLVAMTIIEIMALSAFVADLRGIQTEFRWLKRLLPVLSSVGLAELLWRTFIGQNSVQIAAGLTAVGTLVIIAWLHFAMRGIEKAVFGKDMQSPEEQAFKRLIAIRDAHTVELMDTVVAQGQQLTQPETAVLALPKASNSIDTDMPPERQNGHAVMGFSPAQKAVDTVDSRTDTPDNSADTHMSDPLSAESDRDELKNRLRTLMDTSGHFSVSAAARELGISRQKVYRLKQEIEQEGATT